MLEFEILNLIKNENKNKNTIILNPKLIKKNLIYKITLICNKNIHIQFKFYAKFINKIEFIYNNKSINKYNRIPFDGILFNCNLNIEKKLDIIINPIDLCTIIYIKDIIEYNFETLYNIEWNHIYIINLKRRSDRKENIIKQLEKLEIKNYDFLEAVDGLSLEIKEKYNEIKNININNPISTCGHFGCLLSHINAITLAKQNNYENIMILEDDIFFNDNFIENINKIKIPKYDMIYLGGIINKHKLFLNDWGFANKVMGAYAYIINNSIYDILIEKLKNLDEYIDVFYLKQIQPNYNVFILNDLIKTDLLSSDTSKKSKKMIKQLNYINKK